MIVLVTDFGLEGPYTGQMKAVLNREAPGVPVIDLFADAPSRNPRAAAYLLAAYAAWFPPGVVFLAVVDPGVGGARAPLILEADQRFYVGPDNGLLEIAARRAASAQFREIAWRPEALSASFHGRDLFAPVAARLALGDEPLSRPVARPQGGHPEWPDDLAEIVYVDVYGNAMTGLRAAFIAPGASLEIGGSKLANAATFSAVPPGAGFWYANSNGLAEIAINGGRADAALGIGVGSVVAVTG
jgi:hypothetical protein